MHHPLFPLPFAGFTLGVPELMIVITLILFPFMIVAIVATALYFKFKQRQAWQELVRLALEKGQPIPPYPGQQRHEIKKSWHDFAMSQLAANKRLGYKRRLRDVRAGLVLLAIGAAVYFTSLGAAGSERGSFAFFAYLPAFIGAALLLNGLLDAIFSRKDDDPGAQSPQP